MKIEDVLVKTLKDIISEKYDITPDDKMVMIEIPKDSANGDYSTNLAMRLTKLLRRRPQEIAAEITEEISARLNEVEKTEVAGPGFINFWIKKDAMANIINTVISQNENYGKSNAGKGVKYLEEYVSANPTGPLHCGHARGAVWGDSCVRILNAAGYKATREYYINDAGAQIHNLGLSLYARIREIHGLDFTLPEDGYHGADVVEIAKEIVAETGNYYLTIPEEEAVEKLAKLGRDKELDRIKVDLAYYGCEFDSWVSEKWIVDTGMVDEAVKEMAAKNLTYELDGALWFKATEYGDEKDRVLRKSNGLYTYLTPDIANHKYKYDRGYDVLVNIWGADHHGYIPRMKAAMRALGYNADNLHVDLCQMVRLVENGMEVKMSKRTGNAITLRELIDDIGLDAARYFFLSKALDTHMEFDLGLARSDTNDNPVFYAQYAYARICSVLRQAGKPVETKDTYSLLTHPKETDLLKQISMFPDVVADAAASRAPNLICNYVQKLAAYFHTYYGACKVNDPSKPELSAERLALTEATRITLHNALYLLGVRAPEKMEKSEPVAEKAEEAKAEAEEIKPTEAEVLTDGPQFIAEDDFWEMFPKASLGVILCKNIDNTVKQPEQYSELLRKGEQAALEHLPNSELSSNRVISVWRDAFTKFKTKKGARSSIEALLKRVFKGNQIGNINPLVDIYNSVSLKYAMPCGGEDMDKFVGNIRLTKAQGNEEFITYGGEGENEPPLAGELCYKDDQGAICRCWNWREGVRTMLTEDTKNVFMIIELVDNSRYDEFRAALDELAELITDNLGGTCEIKILNSNRRRINI